MMKLTALVLTVISSVSAFVPNGKVSMRTSALRMGAEDLIGAASKGELVTGFWDPLKLSEGKDDATINYYRLLLYVYIQYVNNIHIYLNNKSR